MYPDDPVAPVDFASASSADSTAASAPVSVLRKPRVWTVFVAFMAALVIGQTAAMIVLVAAAVLMYGAPALAEDPGGILGLTVESVPGLLSALIVNQLAVGGVAIIAALLSPVGPRNRLRWLPGNLSYAAIAISAIGALAFSNAFSCLDGLGLLPKSAALEGLSEWMRSLSGGSRIVALLVVGVLPGFAEELLFRGYIQTRLSQRWGSRVGVIVSAALFGIMHIDPVHATFAFAFGLYLGYLTERSGSIRPAMFCHAVNNSTGVLLASLGWEVPGRTANLVLLVACIGMVSAILWWLGRTWPAEQPIVNSDVSLAEIPAGVPATNIEL